MNETTVVTIKITGEQKERLREIAKQFGYTIGRGNEADWGSIRQLAVALADGELRALPAASRNEG